MTSQKEKILLIIANRNIDKSFNHGLAKEAEKLLIERGHEVKAEQKYSNVDAKGENFADEIKEQQANIRWATTVLYQFPLEWLDIPAILKAYLERVYSYYFAYGGDCNLSGKKWMASVTTGGDENMYKENTVQNYLNSFSSSHAFMKLEEIPMYVHFAVRTVSEDERQKSIENYKAHLLKYF